MDDLREWRDFLPVLLTIMDCSFALGGVWTGLLPGNLSHLQLGDVHEECFLIRTCSSDCISTFSACATGGYGLLFLPECGGYGLGFFWGILVYSWAMCTRNIPKFVHIPGTAL